MKRPTHRGCRDAPSVVAAWLVVSILLVLLAPYEIHSQKNCFRLIQSQQDAATTYTTTQPANPPPVVVAHTGMFWWVLDYGPHWQVPGCSFQGRPLDCQYVSTAHAEGNATAQDLLGQAQALVHEGCWEPATLDARFKPLPQVMTLCKDMLHCECQHCATCSYSLAAWLQTTQVMFSMEPVSNWPCLDSQVADLEMSYRTCSHEQQYNLLQNLCTQGVMLQLHNRTTPCCRCGRLTGLGWTQPSAPHPPQQCTRTQHCGNRHCSLTRKSMPLSTSIRNVQPSQGVRMS